jgi:hypothetical protein
VRLKVFEANVRYSNVDLDRSVRLTHPKPSHRIEPRRLIIPVRNVHALGAGPSAVTDMKQFRAIEGGMTHWPGHPDGSDHRPVVVTLTRAAS